MSPISYLQTADKTKCTGCSACASVCAHKAITMQEDSEGFLFPIINDKQCVQCGLCEKVCPIGGKDQSNEEELQKIYLATTEREDYYGKSATIGVCTMISKAFVEEGGKVFGVILDEKDWKAKHICVDDTAGIERLRNSKYVQSETGQTFLDVLNHLQQGTKVLYIGTPCQIAGLKGFLRKDYDNLLTIDLICHGVYSYKLIKKEVAYWEQKFKGNLNNLKFRSKRKSGGVINFDLQSGKGTKHIEIDGKFSPTYRSFAYMGDNINYNLRTSCYACPFRSSHRYADISVGDAWFINAAKYFKRHIEWRKGVSLFMGNTDKGNQYISKILPLMSFLEISQQDAFVQPALLPASREIPPSRSEVYKSIETTENYAQTIKRLFKVDIEDLYKKDCEAEQAKKRKDKMKNIIKNILLINAFRKQKAKWQPGWEWWFTNSFLYNFPSKHFRNYMLKKMGMKFLGDARIYAGFHIRNPKGIVLGKGVSIGPKVLLDGRKGLTIEEGAVIGYGAIIWTLNHDYNDIHFCGKGARVTIGKHAWICSNSIVMPGISIGEGAVVASGAVVTHDVPPFTIVGGVPARVIGQREKKDYDYGYCQKNDKLHFC